MIPADAWVLSGRCDGRERVRTDFQCRVRLVLEGPESPRHTRPGLTPPGMDLA